MVYAVLFLLNYIVLLMYSGNMGEKKVGAPKIPSTDSVGCPKYHIYM